MTTTDLLREALRADADQAAAPDRVAALRAELLADLPAAAGPVAVRRPRRPRRPRRRPVVLASVAAAAVAALVVALFVSTGSGRGDTPAASGSAAELPLTQYVFGVDDGAGSYPFRYGGTASVAQGGFWTDPASNGDAVAALNVLPAPHAVPRPTGATSVRVGPAAGWTAPHAPEDSGLYFGMGSEGIDLAWTDDSTGFQFVVNSDRLTLPDLENLAGEVRASDPHPVTSPVRLSWLPPGVEFTGVSSSDGYFSLIFGPHGSQLVIGVDSAGTLTDGETHHSAPQPVTVGRFHGEYYDDSASTRFSDGVVDIVVINGAAQGPSVPPTPLPLDTLTHLIAGVDTSPLDAPSTWPTLADALPS